MKNNSSDQITYELIEGKSNVLLTAPHVYNHRRPTLSNSIKQGEPWTDYIVKEIAHLTGAWGLVLKSPSDYDPNYQKEDINPFKQTLRRISEQADITTIIDIHGLSDSHRYDLGILYPRRFSKSRELVYDIADSINRDKLRGVLINTMYLEENPREPLALFSARELRIPAVQIEVARYIREDSPLREEFVRLLSKFVSTI